jgi:hypothetical protein
MALPVRDNPVDLLPVLVVVVGGAWLLSHWPGAAGAGAAPGGAPATSPPPSDGAGQPIYGPPYDPALVATAPDGLTRSYATRDVYYQPIPVSLLPSYHLDPQAITTPITDAIGALVGWLIPIQRTGSGWGTIDPGRGNVAV